MSIVSPLKVLARRPFLFTVLSAPFASACADGGSGPDSRTQTPTLPSTIAPGTAPGSGTNSGVESGGDANANANANANATPSATAESNPTPQAPVATNPRATGIPTSSELDIFDIQVPGDRALGQRFLVGIPKNLKPGEKVPTLVLLHGLGETGDQRLGAYAWVEKYGLVTAYERLRNAPIARTGKRKEWTSPRLAEVNASLQKRPFSGMCLVCPFTPNVNKRPDPAGALTEYTKWLTEVVLPRVRKDAPVHQDAARTALDGCSLGGYVALEVFIRKPDVFGGLGTVQAALSEGRAAGYANRLAAALGATKKPLHFLTSEGDPFLAGNRALAKELQKKGIPCDLRVLPGPHDQPWLREAGTLEMLLFHDLRPKT